MTHLVDALSKKMLWGLVWILFMTSVINCGVAYCIMLLNEKLPFLEEHLAAAWIFFNLWVFDICNRVHRAFQFSKDKLVISRGSVCTKDYIMMLAVPFFYLFGRLLETQIFVFGKFCVINPSRCFWNGFCLNYSRFVVLAIYWNGNMFCMRHYKSIFC